MKGESKVFGLRILLISLLLITSISYAVSRGNVEFNETLFIVKDSIWYSSVELYSGNVISFYALVCTDVERQSSEIAAVRIAGKYVSSASWTIYRENSVTVSRESFTKFAEALERALELELNQGESLYFNSNGLFSIEINSGLGGKLIFGGGRHYHSHEDSSHGSTDPNDTVYGLYPSDIEQICQSASGLAKAIELFNSAKKPIEIVPETVLVERGSFTMGDDSLENVSSSHQVFITYDFYIGKYEVTFDEYDWFVRESERGFLPEDFGCGRGTRPVINVSWNDAIAYCNWLSQKEGLPKAYDSEGNLLDEYGNVTADTTKVIGFRLPTEAEWEYAARGGNMSEGYMYSGSNNLGDVAWYWRNSGDEYLTGEYFLDSVFDNNNETHPVGAKKSNELGIHDMSGNVWELCSDWYDSGYYAKSSTTNPYNYTPGSYRVVRGGGWSSNVMGSRVADRGVIAPDYTDSNVGFRICKMGPHESILTISPMLGENEVTISNTFFSWGIDGESKGLLYKFVLATDERMDNIVFEKVLAQNNLELTQSLLSNKKYFWRVDVIKNGLEIPGEVWFFESKNLPPEVPRLIFPTDCASEVSTIDLTLSWEASDPDGEIVSTIVHLREVGGIEKEYIASGNSLTIENLKGGVLYEWAIEVTDDAGKSSVSLYYSFATGNHKPVIKLNWPSKNFLERVVTPQIPIKTKTPEISAVYFDGALNIISLGTSGLDTKEVRYNYDGEMPIVKGNLIYVIDETGRLVTIDYTSGEAKVIDKMETNTNPEKIVLKGGYLWILDTKIAAVIVKVSLNSSGIPEGMDTVYRDLSTPVDFFVTEDLSRIYLADSLSGIKILLREGTGYTDITPSLDLSLEGYSRAVAEKNGIVFTGEAGIDGGLKIIDTSKSQKSTIGSYYIVLDIVVSDDILYASTNRGIAIVDISTPESPVVLRDLEIVQVDEISASGNILAVKSGNRILIYDISSPSEPLLLDEIL